MKKYYISHSRRWLSILLLVFMILSALWTIPFAILVFFRSRGIGLGIFFLFLLISGLACAAYLVFSGGRGNQFTMDDSGITQLGSHELRYEWTDFAEYGMVLMGRGWRGAPIVWVYGCLPYVPDSAEADFRRRIRRRDDDIFCFIYQDEAYQDFLTHLPQHQQEKLQAEHLRLFGE